MHTENQPAVDIAGAVARPVEYLSLKWGTLKAWQFNEDGPAFAAFKRWHEAGDVALGAMQQRDNAEQKAIICEIIDALNSDWVRLDWDGINVSKDAAKQYVLNYSV